METVRRIPSSVRLAVMVGQPSEPGPYNRSSLNQARRSFLRTLTSAGAAWPQMLSASSGSELITASNLSPSLTGPASLKSEADGDTSIRPFKAGFSDAALAALRRRIAATNWPERETVLDASQGVQLITMRELARYWQTDFDWREVGARLNALAQFTTSIDGLDIHFIHVRSKNANALPVIITHGWPDSIIEQLKIIGPLTNPIAHGGKIDDSFDVVIPSLPGHGFSGKPTTTGWDPMRIARAWVVLMKRLGYTRYVAQGDDWGNAVSEQMALLAPPELLEFTPICRPPSRTI